MLTDEVFMAPMRAAARYGRVAADLKLASRTAVHDRT